MRSATTLAYVVLGSLLTSACRTEDSVDVATGCASGHTRPLTVLAVDVTEAFTPRQGELVRLVVQRAWTQVPVGGELRVYSLDGSAAEALPRLTVCREPPPGVLDGPKTRQFKASVARRDARDREVTAMAGALVSGHGTSAREQASRLFEWASALRGTIDQGYGYRRLVFVTDLRQFSPKYRSNATLPSSGLDWSGFQVSVLVLGEGLHAPPAPWPDLFKSSGADAIEVAIEALPVSVAR